ncbi:MAG: TfoX/Sxy family protein [Endomicrobiales bacterium]|nr:TfoX/Sxy family protein [Endomicrobiales bacterium]
MATKQSTIDYLIDQLAPLRNARARKMFGEYALYCADKVVALVCGDNLFVKKTDAGAGLIEGKYELAPAYPGAKLSMLVGAEVLDDRELLCRLIKTTADSVLPPKPKQPKKPRRKK